MLQYSHICELYHRVFQYVAARGRRNYECLSPNLGPRFPILHHPLGGCRERRLASVSPRFLDSFDAHALMRRDRLFGMMAFFCVFSTITLSMVIWKGPALRRWSLGKDPTEDGVRIISSDRSSDTSIER